MNNLPYNVQLYKDMKCLIVTTISGVLLFIYVFWHGTANQDRRDQKRWMVSEELWTCQRNRKWGSQSRWCQCSFWWSWGIDLFLEFIWQGNVAFRQMRLNHLVPVKPWQHDLNPTMRKSFVIVDTQKIFVLVHQCFLGFCVLMYLGIEYC